MPFIKTLPEDAGPPVIYNTYPDIYRPWSEMSEAMMNGPSAFSAAERELIFTLAAKASGSDFVYAAHSEVVYARGYPRGILDSLLAGDFDVDLPEALKPVLALAIKLAATPNEVTQADADAVAAAGWDEVAYHDIVSITARAVFMHRLTAGFGFNPMSPERARQRAQARISKGYLNLYPDLAAKKD
ncbi:carboxymuconolactone decarboxylase family protein [Oceanicola sp. 22II-s10i]|uniref:carboxymuconolactone decarboxylase family protein n=1 Tax=Oceanicola sp. 22II-s10i TaxID=1317116 RepID=UPI000B521E42|nr:hypothetical protein [Oceanicola sp. 22II-s10i]